MSSAHSTNGASTSPLLQPFLSPASPLNVLCPRRRHFACESGHLMEERLREAPVIVVPPRECITAGAQKSTDVETYSNRLKAFCDFVLDIPTTSVWEAMKLKPKLFEKVRLKDEINDSTVSFWRYPAALVEQQGFQKLPLYRVEWDWSGCDCDEGLSQMRRFYFDPNYIDDQSDYQLIEKLPAFENSPLQSPLVFHALWHAPAIFTVRDWVEYICVDTDTKTVLSRSCLHPKHLEFEQYASRVQQLASRIVPRVGIMRAGCLFCVRFLKPKANKNGCTVQMCFWYSLLGLPDLLFKTSLTATLLEDEYLIATLRQFNSMEETNRIIKANNEDSLAKPTFDLLGS